MLGSLAPLSDEEEIHSQHHDSSFDSEQHLFMEKLAGSMLGTPPAEPLADYSMQDAQSCSVMHTAPLIQHECPITKVADEFLNSFCNIESHVMAIKFSNRLSSLTFPEGTYSKPAMQAFRCCKLIAGQAKEQLKNATFTRFFSLCFFLLWEGLACEPGKAGARVVCILKRKWSANEFPADDYQDKYKNEGSWL